MKDVLGGEMNTAVVKTVISNPFHCIQQMDTKLAELAMTALGGSAIFRAAILISMAIALDKKQEIERELNLDGRNERDAANDASAESERVREEQGHGPAITPDSLRRDARYLIAIREHCAQEIRTQTSNEFAQPQTMEGAITFLASASPRMLRGHQKDVVDNLIKKGTLSKDRVEAIQKQAGERNAENWLKIGTAVYAEYLSMVGTVMEHMDKGASNASEESLGEHAFNQLSPGVAIGLYDKYLQGFASRFETFLLRIVQGFEKEFTIDQIDGLTLLFSKEQEDCRKGRIAYYRAHRHELEEDAGMEATPREVVSAGAAAATAAQSTTPAVQASPIEGLKDAMASMKRKTPDKSELPHPGTIA